MHGLAMQVIDAEQVLVLHSTSPLMSRAHGAPGTLSSTQPRTVTVLLAAWQEVTVTAQLCVMQPFAGIFRPVASRQPLGESVIETSAKATPLPQTITR